MYALGIDLGGTTVKIGIFEADGKLIDKWEILTRKEDGGEAILPDIAASVKDRLLEKNISLSGLEGAGIGVPGAVLPSGIVNRCVNLGWGRVDVASILSGLLDGIPVRVGNDANVAALGEMWQGGGRGCKNIVMVTLGTGVGGGIILNGEILTGTFGAAGEIGHITIHPEETDLCGCGKRGCLEQYASASGITRMARRYLASHDTDTILRRHQNPSAKQIFDAAKTGDAVALTLVDDLGKALGLALASVSAVVDPEVFVIGGGVSKAGSLLIDTVRRHYQAYAFHASRETRFALASLGNDAGIYGSVKMVLS